MKKISFFSLRVMLAVLLCCFSFRAMADEVTLYDGTVTNSYVPVYGNWADAYQRTQCLYSADVLAAAGIEPGATIQSLTYYLSAPADAAWTSLWDVKVVETTATSLSSGYVSLAGATEVLTGATWSATKSTFTIQFATPYVYEGGNLVIDIQNQQGGNYSNAVFYGATVTGASRNGYNSTSTANITGSTYSFAPKTTFNYTNAVSTCARPESLVVEDVTAYSANLKWVGSAPAYELTVNGVSTIETSSSKELTLTPFTSYLVELRAICAEGDTSSARTLRFTTEKTCLAPDTVYFTEPTLDGNTTLTWSGDASMYYLVVSDGGNLLFSDRIGANSFDITGLSSGLHNFIVELSAQCGAHAHEQSDTLSLQISLDVPCSPKSLPWSEGFENMLSGGSSSAAPACWALLNANEGTYPYVYVNTSSSYVHSGSKSLYFQSSSSVDAFAILPVFEAGLAGADLHFWYRNEGTSASNGTVGIGYLTDPTDSRSYVSILDCEKTTTMTEVVVTIPSIPAGARLAFRYAHGSSNNYYAGIDDILIEPANSCPKVSNIHVASVGMTDASIAWSPAEGVSEYAVVITAGADTLCNQVVNDTVVALSNLATSSSYALTVSVCAVCDADHRSNAVTAVVRFSTPTTAPWSEDFENYSNNTVPDGWDNSATTSSSMGSSPYYAWGVYRTGGNNTMCFNNYSARSGEFYTNSPSILLPAGGPAVLEFEYSHTSDAGDMTVSVSTDNGNTFTAVGTFKKGSGTSYTDPGTLTPASIDLSAYAGNPVIIQFYSHGNYGNGAIFIDNIYLGAPATCLKIAGLNLATVGVDTATFVWNAVEGAQNYRVEATVGDSVLTFTTADTCLVLRDLEQATTYTVSFAVYTLCGEGDESAAFSKTVTFTTQLPPLTAPYFENFNGITSGVPEGWDNSLGSTETSAYRFTSFATGYEGRGLRFNSYANGNGNTNKLVSPVVMIPEAGYTLSFWVKNPTGGALKASILSEGAERVIEPNLTGISDWTLKTFSLDEYVGKSIQFVLDATSNYGYGDAYAYFDELSIEQVPTCFPVQEVYVVDSLVSETSATIAWVPATEGGENFLVTVINGSDTLHNAIVNGTSLVIENLTPGTSYSLNVKVVTVCSDEDMARPVTANLQFFTDCAVLAAPYFTSFEDGAACWELSDGISASTSYSYYYEGYGVLQFATTRESYAVLPEIEDLNGNRFTMYYRNEGINATSGSFLMGYMLNNEFVALSDSLPKVFEMTEAFVDFVDVPAGARAAIKYYGASSASWHGYVDNVEVAAIPTCFPASNLHVDSIGRDFVTLAWSPAASEQGYNVVVYNWSDVIVDTYVEDTVLTITGLDHSTGYSFNVEITSVCGEGDNSKTYRSYVDFTTECGVNEITYFNHFAAMFDRGADLNHDCYQTYGDGNSEGWVIGKGVRDNSDNYGGYYATVPYATDTIRVTSVLELPLIGLRAGKQYELSFWAKGTDYQTEDTIAIYVNDQLVMAANAQEIGGEWVNIVDTIAGEGECLVSIRYSSFFGYSFSIDDIIIRQIYEFEASTFEDVKVDETGLFRPYKHSGFNIWTSGTQTLATYVDDSYGMPYYSDVTVSALKDTTFTNDFSAGYDMKSACGTAAEGDQYAVWYNNWYNAGASVILAEPEVLSGMYVTNNTYVVNSILNGDSYAKKFATGDWMKLTVNGYVNVFNETLGYTQLQLASSVDFYLADFRNPFDYKYACDWMWLDLTSLGTVEALGFELTSSDTGDWGMNTPAYFCFDNLGGVAPAQSADYRHIINLPENLWIIGECATANWNPSASMQMTKLSDGVFEVTETMTGTWFAFSGSNSENWDEVNANRLGANPSGATVTLGQAEAITGVAGDYCFTVPAAGTYKFVVDLNAMTVTVTTASGLENVDTDNVAVKFFRDNQVLIRKNGKTHNVLGQQVR